MDAFVLTQIAHQILENRRIRGIAHTEPGPEFEAGCVEGLSGRVLGVIDGLCLFEQQVLQDGAVGEPSPEH